MTSLEPELNDSKLLITYKDIALKLDSSEKTVQSHLGSIFEKWQADSRERLISLVLSSNAEYLVPFEGGPFLLTPKQMLVARFLSKGLTNLEIGGQIDISPRTVQTHLNDIYDKMGIDDRALVIDASLRGGLTTKAELTANELGPWDGSRIQLTLQQIKLASMWANEAIGNLPTDSIHPRNIPAIAKEIYRIPGIKKDKGNLILTFLRGGFTTEMENIAKQLGSWKGSRIQLTEQQWKLASMRANEAIGKLPTDSIHPRDIPAIAKEIYRIPGIRDERDLILTCLTGGFTTQAIMAK